MFVSTFEGNSVQHLVVPVQRHAFRGCHDHRSCLRALDTMLDIYWKSSHGTIGSISLIGRDSSVALTSEMVKKLLPPPVTLSCHMIRASGGHIESEKKVKSTVELKELEEQEKQEEQKEQEMVVANSSPPRTPPTWKSKRSSAATLPASFMANSYPSPIPTYHHQQQQQQQQQQEQQLQQRSKTDMRYTIGRGESVTIRMVMRNTTQQQFKSCKVRLLPYMKQGGHIIMLDEVGKPLSKDGGCFVWSGSLCRTIQSLEANEQITHDIECCMLLPGEYNFATVYSQLSSSGGEDTCMRVQEKCWGSHSIQITVA